MPDLTRNNIAACQIHKRPPDYFFIPEIHRGLVVFKENARQTVRNSLRKVLKACAETSFLACLPENSVPIGEIGFLQDQAAKLKLTIIAGLEHDIALSRRKTAKGKVDYQNSAYTVESKFVVLRPNRSAHEFGRKNFPARVMGHLVLEQIERNPDPQFSFFPIPTPEGSEMNVCPILCSDFLEIASERHRDELDRKIRAEQIDLIAVLSHTHRPDVFHDSIKDLISGGTSRSLPTNILFVNFAMHGGSFCLAYNERQSFRGSDAHDLLNKRIIPADKESFKAFDNWASALQAVRTERTRAMP